MLIWLVGVVSETHKTGQATHIFAGVRGNVGRKKSGGRLGAGTEIAFIGTSLAYLISNRRVGYSTSLVSRVDDGVQRGENDVKDEINILIRHLCGI